MATRTATSPTIVLPGVRRKRGRLGSLLKIARRKPIGAVAGVLCILLILVAIFAPVLAPAAPESINHPRLIAPSASYPFGTDNLFHDIFSRIIVGSRISLGIGLSAVAVGTLFGVLFGLISGYVGGKTDLLISRVMDVIMAFPPLVLAIFILSIFRPTFLSVTVAIGLLITPVTARIVRGSVLSVRGLQYIEAARSVGVSGSRIVLRHILPNVVASIIVIASIQIGTAILAEASLSFLSLGIATAESPSWGKMLQDTRSVWERAWWTAVFPGLAISIAVLSFNLFGDTLRDVLDPRLRQQ